MCLLLWFCSNCRTKFGCHIFLHHKIPSFFYRIEAANFVSFLNHRRFMSFSFSATASVMLLLFSIILDMFNIIFPISIFELFSFSFCCGFSMQTTARAGNSSKAKKPKAKLIKRRENIVKFVAIFQ